MECPACGGGGCDECDEGRLRLDGCPRRRVTDRDEVWDVIDCSLMLKRGMPPVAGGLLDQARVFAEAARFVLSEYARHEAEEIERAIKRK